jgi:hypothetical protein
MESVRLFILHDVMLCECNNTIMVEEDLFKWETQSQVAREGEGMVVGVRFRWMGISGLGDMQQGHEDGCVLVFKHKILEHMLGNHSLGW